MVWERSEQQKEPQKGKHTCAPLHPKMDTEDNAKHREREAQPSSARHIPSPGAHKTQQETPQNVENKDPDLPQPHVLPRKKYGRPQTAMAGRSISSGQRPTLPDAPAKCGNSSLPELCRRHSTQPARPQASAATHQARQGRGVSTVRLCREAEAAGNNSSDVEVTLHWGPSQVEWESKKSRKMLSVRAATAPASLSSISPESISSQTSQTSPSDITSTTSSLRTELSILSGELGDSECSIKQSRSKRSSTIKPKVKRRLRKDHSRRHIHPQQRRLAESAEMESWSENAQDPEPVPDSWPQPDSPQQPPAQPVAALASIRASSDSEDYDTDLEIRFPTPMSPSQDITGRTGYLRACEKLNVSPCTAFLRKAQDEVLKLKYYGLTAKDTKALSIGFLNNVYLCHVDLSYNMVGTEGVIGIAHALRENRHISSLNLSYCFLGNELTGAMAIWTLVECSPNIHELNVSHNCFHSSDYTWFAKILQVRSRLFDLDISENDFGSEGVSEFADALEDNDILEGLKMDWNPLTCVGTAAILKAVTNNIRLKHLSLVHTGLNDISAPKAVLVVMRNDILHTLDLRHNHLSKTSLRNLTTALELANSAILLRL